MSLENFFISQFKSRNIGDDGAFIDGYVYSKDAFFENIHFKTKWMNHYEIAKKAMLVNISDAIAMNAKPLYALLSVAMPKSITKTQMRDLAKGFLESAAKYSVEIIGGDTISNTKLDITITIISKTKKPIYRTGIKNGHLLAYTGDLGRSYKDLQRLLNLGVVGKNAKFKNILLRDSFMRQASSSIVSAMDISDGLFCDLGKLSHANTKGFHFFKKISKRIGCSGEEYELLFAFDARNKKRLKRIAQATRTPITIFAKARRSNYTNRCKAHHF